MMKRKELVRQVKEMCIEDFEDSVRLRGSISEENKEALIDDIFQAVDEAYSLVKKSAEEGDYE